MNTDELYEVAKRAAKAHARRLKTPDWEQFLGDAWIGARSASDRWEIPAVVVEAQPYSDLPYAHYANCGESIQCKVATFATYALRRSGGAIMDASRREALIRTPRGKRAVYETLAPGHAVTEPIPRDALPV